MKEMALTLEKMYEGIPFSPPSTLTQTISATDTIIPVANLEHFPDAPNIVTIGIDENAETIIYAAKTDTALSGCVRGIEGTAKDWDIGSVIGRNFTNEDYKRVANNILTMKKEIENQAKQINVLSGNKRLNTYNALGQIGLTDNDFVGLGKIESFDLLISKLRNYGCLRLRLDSGHNNLRLAIAGDIWGSIGTGTFELNTYSHLRYESKILKDGDASIAYMCCGWPGTFGGWKPIATTETIDISSFIVDGWVLQWGELKAFRNGNLVTIQCQIQNPSTGILNIFSGLPVSIRPSRQRMCNIQSGRVSSSNKTFYDILIDTNGVIRIGSASPYLIANTSINLLITYPL